MAYNGAFNCAKCPRSGDPQAASACPAWWSLVEKNQVNGDTRLTQDCAFIILPRIMVDNARGSDMAAHLASKAFNAVEKMQEVIYNVSARYAAGQFSGYNQQQFIRHVRVDENVRNTDS